MKLICRVSTGVGLPILGVTVTGPPGLQRLGRATAAATGPVGLPGRRGNSRPKPIKIAPKVRGVNPLTLHMPPAADLGYRAGEVTVERVSPAEKIREGFPKTETC